MNIATYIALTICPVLYKHKQQRMFTDYEEEYTDEESRVYKLLQHSHAKLAQRSQPTGFTLWLKKVVIRYLCLANSLLYIVNSQYSAWALKTIWNRLLESICTTDTEIRGATGKRDQR